MSIKILVLIIAWEVCLLSGRPIFGQPAAAPEPPTATRINGPAETPTFTVRKNLEFKKTGGVIYKRGRANGIEFELACDVYVPEGEGPFPAILAVHGGSWTSGTKLHMIRHAWKMAARGYVVVAINYRHAPKYKFPAQIHDCKDAIRWMRKNAAEHKIDSSRIAGYGYSAGGHLVSLLGTSDPKDGLEGDVDEGLESYSTRIQAVAAGGAPCEFEWVSSSSLAFWIGATKNRRPKLYRKAAPTTYVDQDDPPFFLYHGEQDALVPLSSTLKMQDILRENGVECVHETLKGKGHFWTFSDFKMLDRVLDFFDEKLMKQKQKMP